MYKDLIREGDRVMVAFPQKCCGSSEGIGVIFDVQVINEACVLAPIEFLFSTPTCNSCKTPLDPHMVFCVGTSLKISYPLHRCSKLLDLKEEIKETQNLEV